MTAYFYRIIFEIGSEEYIEAEELKQIASLMGAAFTVTTASWGKTPFVTGGEVNR